jgi:exopolysaccharide biosynthesis polyprenyl glycosylphosphotransferase
MTPNIAITNPVLPSADSVGSGSPALGVGSYRRAAAVLTGDLHTERLETPRLHRHVLPSLGARLALADSAATGATLLLALALMGRSTDGVLALLGMLALFGMCTLTGAYEQANVRLSTSTLDQAPRLLTLSGLLALVLTIIAPVLIGDGFTGQQAGVLWLSLFAGLALGRTLLSLLDRHPQDRARCVVIGDASQAERLRSHFEAGGVHASIVAAIPLTTETLLEEPEADLELSIRNITEEFEVQRIIVAPPQDGLIFMPKLLRTAKAIGLPISFMPQMLEAVGHAMEFDDIDGMTLIGVRPFGLSRSSRYLKRVFDVLAASVLIVLFAPLLIAITLAVMIDSRGAVLFKQVRVGRDGRHFKIFKFRSMVSDAEALKEELRSLSEGGLGLFKIADDPRITRIGRFLRSTSLDELPQIFNVLRGEMSLVGPRPLVVDEDSSICGLDRGRLHLMPGMTGPWQVLRVRASRPEMVAIDYRYVAGWSLWTDLKILVRTFLHVAHGRNV